MVSGAMTTPSAVIGWPVDDRRNADDQPIALPGEAAEHPVAGDRAAVGLEHGRLDWSELSARTGCA